MATPAVRPVQLEIEVQGLIYKTPLSPRLTEIRGYHIPKRDQVWHRREEYLQWDWSQGWQRRATPEQKKWFDEEVERLHKGDWIYINGVPTFFNKYCYFFHQWFKVLQGVYPTYKDTSLEYFYFYELCEIDPMCLGDIGIKGRRVGLSSMSASIKLLIALLESKTLSGIVSKTGTDAYEMYLMVKNGLDNLPEFLMPDVAKSTETEIKIAKPNAAKVTADRGKDNRINWLDTAENSYDGRPLRHLTIDEAAKWWPKNVKLLFRKIVDTLVQGAYILGHVSVFSTVNRGDRGGDNFRELYLDSDHINGKKDKYGRTKTKLKRFFLPAYKGYMGYVGKYGESIIENPTHEQIKFLKENEYWNPIKECYEKCPDPYVGAKQFQAETRKMLEDDPEDLAEEIRNNPWTWQEVFKGANNRCNFNLDELNDHIAAIEAELQAKGQKEYGRQGRFVKIGGEVKFEDDKRGKWWIIEFPTDVNRAEYKNSIRCPSNCIYGAAGLDTFANAKNTVDPGSDACLIICKRYDVLDPDNSFYPVAMYVGRPEIKEDFHDEIYWGLEYYGIQMLAERAPTDWEDYATRHRLASPNDVENPVGYLVTTRRSNNSWVYGIATTGGTGGAGEYKEQHLTEMKEHAKFHLKKIKFLRLLKEMVKFDIDDRTDYDACMAWGYALIALKAYKLVEKVKVTPREFMRQKKSKTYY